VSIFTDPSRLDESSGRSDVMTDPKSGAAVFAAHNSRMMRFAYRELENGKPGRLIAWLDKKSAKRLSKTQQLYEGTVGHQSIAVWGIPSSDIWSNPTPTFDTGGARQNRSLTWEWDGTMRNDSDKVFHMGADCMKARYPGTELLSFDNVHDDLSDEGDKSDSLKHFMTAVRKIKPGLDYFAYFGHGSKNSLVSAQLHRTKTPKEFNEFIKILNERVKPGGTIVFYACDTGDKDGFAQTVAARVSGRTVFGHDGAGDARTRPFVVRCFNRTREPFQELLGKDFHKWEGYIKSCSDIWRRFPWMSIEEIRNEVSSGVANGHHADDYDRRTEKKRGHEHKLHQREYGPEWDSSHPQPVAA
jgi:hypothetical protein